MESLIETALKSVDFSPATVIAIICIAVLCYVIRQLFGVISEQGKSLGGMTTAVTEIKTLISTVLTMGGGR